MVRGHIPFPAFDISHQLSPSAVAQMADLWTVGLEAVAEEKAAKGCAQRLEQRRERPEGRQAALSAADTSQDFFILNGAVPCHAATRYAYACTARLIIEAAGPTKQYNVLPLSGKTPPPKTECTCVCVCVRQADNS